MQYADKNGVLVDDLPRILPRPSDTHLWPPANIVRDLEIVIAYRGEHQHCQLCGAAFQWDVRKELHHIIGGAGRSDERCNLIVLCNGYHGCHGEVHGNLPLILWAKWLTNKEDTDWVRLAVLARKFLPVPCKDDHAKVCNLRSGESR